MVKSCKMEIQAKWELDVKKWARWLKAEQDGSKRRDQLPKLENKASAIDSLTYAKVHT